MQYLVKHLLQCNILILNEYYICIEYIKFARVFDKTYEITRISSITASCSTTERETSDTVVSSFTDVFGCTLFRLTN